MTTTNKPRIEPRKPGSVQAAAGFIAGGAATMAPPVAATKGTAPEPTPSAVDSPVASEATAAPVTNRKGTMNRRRTGKEVRQLTVYLPPEVEKQLRLVAVEEDRLPSDVIADALRMYFGDRR